MNNYSLPLCTKSIWIWFPPHDNIFMKRSCQTLPLLKGAAVSQTQLWNWSQFQRIQPVETKKKSIYSLVVMMLRTIRDCIQWIYHILTTLHCCFTYIIWIKHQFSLGIDIFDILIILNTEFLLQWSLRFSIQKFDLFSMQKTKW